MSKPIAGYMGHNFKQDLLALLNKYEAQLLSEANNVGDEEFKVVFKDESDYLLYESNRFPEVIVADQLDSSVNMSNRNLLYSKLRDSLILFVFRLDQTDQQPPNEMDSFHSRSRYMLDQMFRLKVDYLITVLMNIIEEVREES